ncbi:MAG: winged helix-turn-helix transcriptional regulator [Clostridia bacterium]|nr:winged helix-turn-helix transcriptional regulator [Clostridia bacterium]
MSGGTSKGHSLLGEQELDTMCDFFKMMADRTRLRILMELLEGSLCVMHISERVGMSQSATSHQLALLRKAKLVHVTRKGKSVAYSISDEHVRLMLDTAMLHVHEEE